MCCTSVAEFAEVCQKEITKFEADIELDTSDGKTVTFLRFVSKLFYKDGTGDPLYASSYILSQGIQKIPIMNYRGPRFNVLFYNAAGTFCWAKHLIDYIQNSKSTMNFTVTYILKALMNNIILALCRALGIICKIITEPYLDRSSDETTTALSIGNVYGRLIHVLEISSDNPHLLLSNNISGLIKPGEVGEILSLFRLKSLSLDYKAKLKSPCFFLQVTLFLQIIFVLW